MERYFTTTRYFTTSIFHREGTDLKVPFILKLWLWKDNYALKLWIQFASNKVLETKITNDDFSNDFHGSDWKKFIFFQ